MTQNAIKVDQENIFSQENSRGPSKSGGREMSGTEGQRILKEPSWDIGSLNQAERMDL